MLGAKGMVVAERIECGPYANNNYLCCQNLTLARFRPAKHILLVQIGKNAHFGGVYI